MNDVSSTAKKSISYLKARDERRTSHDNVDSFPNFSIHHSLDGSSKNLNGFFDVVECVESYII